MSPKNVRRSSFRTHGSVVFSGRPTTRDLPTDMSYSRADALVVQRSYTYDNLGRPTARDLARYGTQTSDTFGYNTRSELTTARVNSADYSYAYDAIGNRTSATEAGTRTAYTANKLNQYTAEGSFRPTFDADGNQTLIKTSTGTWNVTYNAKNRPVLFAKSDGSVTVECTYDTMGRRATKKVTTNGTLTEHRRFLYRGYLQIDSPPPHRRLTPAGQSRFAHCPTGLTAVVRLACCDLTRAYTPALWFITWDPTQPTATRPLAIQKNGTWYSAPARLAPQGSRSQVCSRLGVWLLKPHPAYGWDLTKNICETYRTDARIDLAYTYTPYGEVSPAHTYDQPLRWSSEYHDVELGLHYYNYRHYNPAMGRWLGRDFVQHTAFSRAFHNSPTYKFDHLGLWEQSYENPHVWKASKGDTLSGLAVLVGGSYDDWQCLWPEASTDDHGYPHKIRPCDMYNTSNLTDEKQNLLHLVISLDLDHYLHLSADFLMVYPSDVPVLIQEKSQEGGLPITDFIVAGHGGFQGLIPKNPEIEGPLIRENYSVNDIIWRSVPASFSDAKEHRGPSRCWFSKKATARFIGCSTSKYIAEDFSKRLLRRGSKAYGTNSDIIGYNIDGKGVFISYGSDDFNPSTAAPIYESPVWDPPFYGSL